MVIDGSDHIDVGEGLEPRSKCVLFLHKTPGCMQGGEYLSTSYNYGLSVGFRMSLRCRR